MDLNKYLKDILDTEYSLKKINLEKDLNKIDTARIDDSLSEYSIMFKSYNKQVEMLKNLEYELETYNLEIEKTSRINDDILKKWYIVDIPIKTRNRISFSQYKKDITKIIDKKLESSKLEFAKKTHEYYSNLYYFVEIKNDIKKELFDKQESIKIHLQRNENNLNKLMLGLKNFSKGQDDVNSYGQVDEILKSNAELNYQLYIICDYLNLIKFDRLEIDLINKGLNSLQKEIYYNLEKEYIPENKIEVQELLANNLIVGIDDDKDTYTIDNQQHAPQLISKILPFIKNNGKSVQFEVDIISNTIKDMAKVNNEKQTKMKMDKLDNQQEIVNIEVPNGKLKVSIYKLRENLKTIDGMSRLESAMIRILDVNKIADTEKQLWTSIEDLINNVGSDD